MFLEGVKYTLDLWSEDLLEDLDASSLSAEDFSEFRDLLGNILAEARRAGLLALEDRIDGSDLPEILEAGLRMAVDGTDPEAVYAALADRVGRQPDPRRRMMAALCLQGVLAVQDGLSEAEADLTLRALTGSVVS